MEANFRQSYKKKELKCGAIRVVTIFYYTYALQKDCKITKADGDGMIAFLIQLIGQRMLQILT